MYSASPIHNPVENACAIQTPKIMQKITIKESFKISKRESKINVYKNKKESNNDL